MPYDVVDSIERLESLAPAWDELWRRLPGATPFQSPHWLLPWWRHFGSDTLHVIAGRNGDRLDALSPLYVLRDEESDETLGLFLGTGVSDYLDLLVPNGQCAATVAEMASAGCMAWDLQQLRPSSPLLSATPPRGWTASVEEQDRCPVLALEGAAPDLGGLLSSHARKKLRYFRRLAEREGPIAFAAATAETLVPALESLFVLHAARWRERGLPGVLADDVVQQFHREAARRLLDSGTLRLYSMRIGDRTVAVYYGFAHQGTHYYYLSGYDPAQARLGLGNLLVAHAVEQAVREGAAAFDFLRGAEEYKYAWGAADRVNRRMVWLREGS